MRTTEELEQRVKELEELISLAGAQQRPDGEWVWPYYHNTNGRTWTELLPTEEWLDARMQAAVAIASCRRLLGDV